MICRCAICVLKASILKKYQEGLCKNAGTAGNRLNAGVAFNAMAFVYQREGISAANSGGSATDLVASGSDTREL